MSVKRYVTNGVMQVDPGLPASAGQSRYVPASDYAALEEHAEKLTLALRGANKYPEECVEGGACTSALAYEELLIEREALRTALQNLFTACNHNHSETGAPYHEPCSICRAMGPARAALDTKEGT